MQHSLQGTKRCLKILDFIHGHKLLRYKVAQNVHLAPAHGNVQDRPSLGCQNWNISTPIFVLIACANHLDRTVMLIYEPRQKTQVATFYGSVDWI